MKQLGARSEDVVLWDKGCKELYKEDERGNRNELLSKVKLSSRLAR